MRSACVQGMWLWVAATALAVLASLYDGQSGDLGLALSILYGALAGITPAVFFWLR